MRLQSKHKDGSRRSL